VRTKTPEQSDKMLDAAAKLFGTQRFHEVRMEDIAAEAEVGKGTLYRYFEDKEELYFALLARSSNQFVSLLQQEIRGEKSAVERLEGLVRSIIAYFDGQPHLLDLIQRAEILQPSGRESPWQKIRGDVFHVFTRLFEEARDAGEFSIRDPELAVYMLLGGLRSIIRLGKKPRPSDLASVIVRDFLGGAAKAAGPRAKRLSGRANSVSL
jgi:AcrR family transcriptional regulator